MRADPPPRRGPVARLADLLAEAAGGARPTSVELAELLWLAGQMGGEVTPPDASDVVPSGPPPAPPSEDPPRPQPAEPTPAPAPDDRVPLRLPAPAGRDAAGASATPAVPSGTPDAPDATAHTPVRVPVPPMVTHPLTLQRALRPLKRRVPSPWGRSSTRRPRPTASPAWAATRVAGFRSCGPPKSAGCVCAWCTTRAPRCRSGAPWSTNSTRRSPSPASSARWSCTGRSRTARCRPRPPTPPRRAARSPS